MCLDLYGNTTSAARVDDVLAEDARRRKLRRAVRPLRPGVAVVAVVAPADAEAVLDHVDRERHAFWRHNLELEAVLVAPPGTPFEPLLRSAAHRVLARAISGADGVHEAVNSACVTAALEAVLLVDGSIAFPASGTPLLQMYLHLSSAPDRGVVAPVLWGRDGIASDGGVRIAAEASGECVFVPEPIHCAPLWGEAALLQATASRCLMARWRAFVGAGGLDPELTPGPARVALCLGAGRLGLRTHRLNGGPFSSPDAPGLPLPARLSDVPRMARRWCAYLRSSGT
jgi:hypothetical protein